MATVASSSSSCPSPFTSRHSSHHRGGAPTPFAYPFGPSTRFHTRERSNTQQNLFPRQFTHAIAPSLSTAARAHRRAQSAITVPLVHSAAAKPEARRTTNTAHNHNHNHNRSQHYQRLSRHSRHSRSQTMASTSASASAPFTPAKQHPHSSSLLLQDSPFSDYFTDEARSSPINDTPSSSYSTTSHSSSLNNNDNYDDDNDALETQNLLSRLSELQAQVAHDGFGDKRNRRVIERKISELDHELAASHSQTRLPPELEDSGLFLEDEDSAGMDSVVEGQEGYYYVDGACEVQQPRFHQHRHTTGARSKDEAEAEESKIFQDKDKAAETEFFMLEAQRILSSVTKAHEMLRSHQTELRAMQLTFDETLQEREEQISQLREENTQLKADLSFDHSDLLLLKMQFRTLVIHVKNLERDVGPFISGGDGGAGESDDDDGGADGFPPELERKVWRWRQRRVQDKIQLFRDSAKEITEKQRRKRKVYDLPSPDLSKRVIGEKVEEAEDDEEEEEDAGVEEIVQSDEETPTKDVLNDEDSAQFEPSFGSTAIAGSSGEELEASPSTLLGNAGDSDASHMNDDDSGQENKGVFGETLESEINNEIGNASLVDDVVDETLESEMDRAISEDEAIDKVPESESNQTSSEATQIEKAITDTTENVSNLETIKAISDDEQPQLIPDDIEDNECAITTSSEASDDDDDDYTLANDSADDEDSKKTDTKSLVATSNATSGGANKTAWQDLWEGLTNFAGLGDDRFD